MGVQLDLYFVRERENCVDLLNLLFIKPSHKSSSTIIKGTNKDPCLALDNHKIVLKLHSYDQNEFINDKCKLLKED
jgi:hypothetical protein